MSRTPEKTGSRRGKRNDSPDLRVERSIVWNKAVSRRLGGEGEPGQITPAEESAKGTAEVER